MTMTASPIPKKGMCPAGYTSSGEMCVPGSNARPAIAKNGMCPLGLGSIG